VRKFIIKCLKGGSLNKVFPNFIIKCSAYLVSRLGMLVEWLASLDYCVVRLKSAARWVTSAYINLLENPIEYPFRIRALAFILIVLLAFVRW
jgi:hypothetical protein